MRKIFLIIILFAFNSADSFAQLANWTPGSVSGYTNFPVNVSGQINGFCRISQMKFHVTDANRLYAVTAEGGFFTSNDAGANWSVRPCTENNTSRFASICIDRTNDQVIYLGAGDANYYSTSGGGGIYKSIDGGNTMSLLGISSRLVIEILQDPNDANTFVAATNGGIYKSTNNGSTWAPTTSTSLQFCDLKQNTAANSSILYACTRDNASRFFRSTDFGGTWTEITNGITTATNYIDAGGRIGVTPSNPNVVYFEAIGGGGIIHKSNDGGISFTIKKPEGAPFITFYSDDPTSSTQGNYNNAVMVDVNNPAKLWLHSHSTWVSVDSGVTWTMQTHWASILHTDMHQLTQSPYDANKLYSCNDGGVWLSTDGGVSWTPKSNGLYAYEVYTNAGKGSNTNRSNVTIGTQDNGRVYRTATGWFTDRGGDDTRPKEYDYLPSGGYYYEKTQNIRRAAGGSSTTSAGFPTTGNYWEHLAFNRSNTNVGFMWFTDNNLYRTTNLSATTPTWSSVVSFTAPVVAMHSSVADINRLYIITNDAKIHVSSNAMSPTPTFTSYTLPSASNSLASIAAIANNANTVYISINNRVYVSTDAGATWTNISYNLPNVNHRKILAEQYGGTQELVFIATNNAVYYKKAGQTIWTNYSTNLPGRKSPTDFSMYDDGTNQSLLRYSSYGRAIFETPFGNLRTTASAFDVNQKLYCTTGSPVIYTDYSTGNITSWSWSFPGGTPATSTLQNPVVTYNSPGLYGAVLTVSDGVTTSTFSKSNLILVMAAAPTVNTGCSITANSNLNNGFGIGISLFSLQNIHNTSSYNNGHYNDYSCSQWTTLMQGSTYNATISTGTTNAEGGKMYIDLNNNGTFEEATEALVTYPSNNSGTRTVSFTVPASGVVLNTGLRLRVVSRFNSVPSNACNVSTYGQAEDYTVYILAVPSAVLSNGTGSSAICVGQSANAKVNITGGTGPYTITLSDGTNNQTINNYTSGANVAVSPLVTSTYSLVTVLDYFGISIPVSGSAAVTLNAYSITASAGANGSITNNGTTTVLCGNNQSYTITPDAGYIVQDVLVDGVSQGPTTNYTFNNVMANHTISASFAVACLPNTWTGATNSLWSTPSNWDCGVVPSAGADVTIPNVTNDPVLDASVTTGNISIEDGATLAIGNNTFAIYGTVTGTGTLSGSASSNLIVNATTILRFTTGANTLKNLSITTGTTTLANALDISAGLFAGNAGTVTVSPGAMLATGDNLTFKSNEFGTARLATGDAAGNYITGQVTVERYIPNNSFRSWRLLSVPTYGAAQTIRQAWQEGTANPLPQQNNIPGFGTQVTGTGQLATAQAAGFDDVTVSGALLSWGGASWTNVTSTNNPIETKKGYFLYIRGERSKGVTGASSNSSATTLRTTGYLYEGDQTFPSLPANSFNLIGNLYPSAINFSSLIRTGGVNNLFYIWDSKKLNGSSLGVYQTFSATNGFNCLISGGSYTPGLPNTTIESGQAFFVTTGASSGSITLTEASKVNSGTGNAGFRPANALVKIDSRLYRVSGNSSTIVDANAVIFDKAYSNAFDKDDALKLSNKQENFGVSIGENIVAVEGRQPLTGEDIIHFNMWNIQQQKYKLEFVPRNLGSLSYSAFLNDTYLRTSTPVSLNGNTSIYFTVTADPSSAAQGRFSLVLKKAGTMLPAEVAGFTLSPNPVSTNRVNILFANQPTGKYSVRLLSRNGQLVINRVYIHAGGSSGLVLILPANMSSGTYDVEIVSPDNSVTTKTLLINKD